MKDLKLQELTMEEVQSIDGGSMAVAGLILGAIAIEVGLCAICYQIGKD
ncbi:MAG: hypothetical protein LBV74_11605 [Tannerella sp.]|jgi:hypothetical protein|nr:hypothetical protein [Tannerella sp.]